MEHVFGVVDDDGHRTHGDSKHGEVDCSNEDEVAAEGGVGAWAGRPKSGEGGEDVPVFEGGMPRLGLVAAVIDVLLLLLLFSGGHLAVAGEGFRDDECQEEKKDAVACQSNPENRQDITGSFNHVPCEYGPQSYTAEQDRMEVSKRNCSPGWSSAVTGICICQRQRSDKGARKTLEDRAQEYPIHMNHVRVYRCNDDNKLRQKRTQDCECNYPSAAVAIRKRS